MSRQATIQTTAKPANAFLWFFILGLPLYLLSTGPVAWATNNGYLPDTIGFIYLPLIPFMQIEWVRELYTYYTAVIWHGFPYGHTTL